MTAHCPNLSPLPTASRPAALGVILALHLLLGLGVLWLPVKRQVSASEPLQVMLLTPPRPPAPPAPLRLRTPRPAAPQLARVPEPELKLQVPPEAPRISAAPATAFDPAPVAVAAASAPQPQTTAAPTAAAPASLALPPSAVQYLVRPAVAYPPASRRLNETGLVVVAVLVGADGLPQQVRLAQSSGFERLDHAALDGVRRARFRPWMLNGRATAGWARIPIPFELTG